MSTAELAARQPATTTILNGIIIGRDDMAPPIHIPPRRVLPAAAVVLLTFLAACTTTRFPESPDQHRLYGELLVAGDQYYFDVRAGVASRVMGIPPETEARAAVAEIERRWPEIDPMDTAGEIVTYLQGVGLTEVATRIQETLDENASGSPPGGADEHIEAAAVKQGLIDAAFEFAASE